MQANLKPAIKVEAVVRTAQRVAGPVVTAAVVNKTKPLVESPAPPPPPPAPVAAPVPVRVAPPVPKQPAAPVSRPVAPAPVPRPAPPARKASSLDNLLDSLEDV